MHKKVSNELNFWHRIYLPEVIRGIWITSCHFFSNLMTHILHVFGLAKKKKGMVTYEYPEDPRPTSLRFRGRHRLMKRADGSTRCVACMMCETVCPAHCIYIVAEEDPDPRIEKRPRSFDINLGLCVVCGYCVDACPEDAIRMDTYIRDTCTYTRDELQLTLEDLMDHDNQDMYPLP